MVRFSGARRPSTGKFSPATSSSSTPRRRPAHATQARFDLVIFARNRVNARSNCSGRPGHQGRSQEAPPRRRGSRSESRPARASPRKGAGSSPRTTDPYAAEARSAHPAIRPAMPEQPNGRPRAQLDSRLLKLIPCAPARQSSTMKPAGDSRRRYVGRRQRVLALRQVRRTTVGARVIRALFRIRAARGRPGAVVAKEANTIGNLPHLIPARISNRTPSPGDRLRHSSTPHHATPDTQGRQLNLAGR